MNKLDKYEYTTTKGFASRVGTILTYQVVKKYFYGENCIDLGCADGGGTKILLDNFKRVVAVDASEKMLEKLRKNITSHKLHVIKSYIENLKLDEKFDTIILSHILEHVDDPIRVLKVARSLAHGRSRIIIDVPNAFSLHRQAGVLLGQLKSEYYLNEQDASVGHQRVYDMEKLLAAIDKVNLKVIKTGGFFLKPFSNAQLEQIINSEIMINAYNQLGEKYPDVAAEIYAICSL